MTEKALPQWSLTNDQLLLMTIRTHDQFNTTIYTLDDRYRGLYGERRVILMHADDVAARGLASGDWVDITSHHDGTTREAAHFAVVPYNIPRGCVATYFPETNVLVPLLSQADESGTPTSKSIVVTLEKERTASAA